MIPHSSKLNNNLPAKVYNMLNKRIIKLIKFIEVLENF
ncbi:hypothetical protein CWATWH0005_2037 [Crocosphaera watsonii WH 0005]|uniref:Uncharacterized protein n=1 Tax=Crocosphaera watsonii WH 0005 TaxID=423472 RepID=T2IQX5_CROWT|nr:hypothetical protein CWATWH0005_2037 [Crocosphaera watsonii WH 0005]